MQADEDLAERIDEEKYAAELAARQAEVDAAISEAAAGGLTARSRPAQGPVRVLRRSRIVTDHRRGVGNLSPR